MDLGCRAAHATRLDCDVAALRAPAASGWTDDAMAGVKSTRSLVSPWLAGVREHGTDMDAAPCDAWRAVGRPAYGVLTATPRATLATA